MSLTEDEVSEKGVNSRSRLESYMFSCVLSSEIPFYTFQGDDDDNDEHFLELRTICLGEDAKEENNVVEVTAMNHLGKKVSVPLANLNITCLPMVSLGEFELMAPVTLRLKSGSGPVTISGQHLVATENDISDMSDDDEDDDDDDNDDDDDDDDDEDDASEEELPSVKPAKKSQPK